MDYRDAQRFVARLHNAGDEFEVAYLKPDAKPSRVKRFLTEGLFEEMERAEANGFNVYISVLPTALQGNAYDRVWVDQDDPTAPFPFGADESWEGANWPEPTTFVKTSEAEGGFRWQAIWLLDSALSDDDGKTMVKRLAQVANSDGAVHDNRRVLRVPGIMNAKRGTMAQLISTSDGTINADAFSLPTLTAVDKLLSTQVNNPAHVLGEWLEGPSEGDRNRKAYVTARFLKSCGVTIEDAGPILKIGAMRADPPLDDHELMHSLNSAYYRK